MARSYRTERAANVAPATRAAHVAQTRADWRAVLAARDSKRAARRIRTARRASTGSVNLSHLVIMLCILGFAALTLAAGFSLARGAVRALDSRPSCDSLPIERADSRAEVVASLSACR